MRRRLWLLPVGFLALLLALTLGRWTVAAIGCGHAPIETSDFAAANSYTMPGDGTYTHLPLFDGFACTLREVRDRNHNTLR